MKSKASDRRRFLKNTAALAGLAVGATGSATSEAFGATTPDSPSMDLMAYGGRSHYETTARKGTRGLWSPGPVRDFGLRTPLQDSVGMITPSGLHFVISHDYDPPDIDPAEYRLLIHGMVDRPLIFSLDDLKRLPSVSQFHFVECHGNSAPSGITGAMRVVPTATAQDTHGLTSCSEWTGVPISVLLKEAGVQKGAAWIVAEGSEGGKHSKSIPLEKAMDDCLAAYGQNGEELRPQQGYPVRLLVPGWQGINNVKWLRRVKVVDEPYMAMMESTKYPSLKVDGKARWFEGELGAKSVITRPSGGQQLPGPGFYEITGLAWSGAGAVRRVEVSTDNGKTWKDAEIQGTAYRKAHTRFGLGWDWNGEETVLLSRCTDDTGQVQPTIAEIAKIWNITVEEIPKMTTMVGNFNGIQPWRVTREGKVFNALV